MAKKPKLKAPIHIYKFPERKRKEKCKHEELTPYAVFVDDWLNEPWLLQTCEQCGQSFVIMGSMVKVV